MSAWRWANKASGWRTINGPEYDLDIIKEGGGYVVELRKHGEFKRSYDRCSDYATLAQALLYAADYSAYMNDPTGTLPRPLSYDDKYFA